MEDKPPEQYKRKADSERTVADAEPRRGKRNRRQPRTGGLLPKPHPEQKYGGAESSYTEEEKVAAAVAKEIEVIAMIKKWATVWIEEPVFNPTDEAVILDLLLAMCKVHSCSTCSLTSNYHINPSALYRLCRTDTAQ
jgi:hypothetical protein